MRRIALALLLTSCTHSAYAQTVRGPDGQPVQQQGAPVYVEPGFNPGEPTTGAGDVATPQSIPEGATQRPVQQLPPGAVVTSPNAGGDVTVIDPPVRRPTRRLLNSLAELDAPLTPEEITAYGEFVRREIPLRPQLILDLKKRRNDVARAQAQPPNGREPVSITDSVRVSLSTMGEAVPLATSQGVVSALSFFDRTGAAWPVAAYVIGDESKFQVYPMQEGSNVLAVSQLVAYGYSNLVVSLVGASQPLTFDLETSDEIVHFRRDVTINANGPNAEIAPVVAKVTEPDMRSSDGLMMAVVQGAPIPPSAIELTTSAADVEAYKIGDNYYIRTSQVLISPSYDAAISGPGGINAYRLKPAPVALITRNGQVENVRISQ